jgi:hypothetical protein
MKATGQYDKELQMYCDAVREVNFEQLRFLRWLAEQGKLEHETFGQPTGEFAELVNA